METGEHLLYTRENIEKVKDFLMLKQYDTITGLDREYVRVLNISKKEFLNFFKSLYVEMGLPKDAIKYYTKLDKFKYKNGFILVNGNLIYKFKIEPIKKEFNKINFMFELLLWLIGLRFIFELYIIFR